MPLARLALLVVVMGLAAPLASRGDEGSVAAIASLMGEAAAARQAGRLQEAAALVERALDLPLPVEARGARAGLLYDLACLRALGGAPHALAALEDAVEAGWTDATGAAADADLVSLRAAPGFGPLLERMRAGATRRKVYEVTRWEVADAGRAGEHRFDDPDGPSMKALRARLATAAATSATQLERQLAVMAWVHGRWSHDGWATPSRPDALTILDEAAAGKRFRCVEYSVVLAAALVATGSPARVVGLRRDGASYGTGKGHVVAEAWNDELGKWLVLDGQNNGTWRDGQGVPLDADEVRARVLAGRGDEVSFVCGPSPWRAEPAPRASWIVYFHHIVHRLDNRQYDAEDRAAAGSLSLVARGAPPELLFQGRALPGQAFTSERARVYPALRGVHLDLVAPQEDAPASPVVVVSLVPVGPAFARLRVEVDGEQVQVPGDRLEWQLRPGLNRLEVRAEHRGGTLGPPSRIELRFHPPG